MAVYKCIICGTIYDEEKEGKPVAQLSCCPVCKQPASNLIAVEAQDSTPVALTGGGSLDYDPATARHDPSARYMKEIHEMAVTGKSISGAMGTKLPLPS